MSGGRGTEPQLDGFLSIPTAALAVVSRPQAQWNMGCKTNLSPPPHSTLEVASWLPFSYL